MIANVWLIPALPLAAFLANGLFGRRWLKHATGWIAAGAMLTSAAVAVGVFLEVLGGHERTTVTLYRWIGVGEFNINVSALVDPLSSHASRLRGNSRRKAVSCASASSYRFSLL